jgi:uncharacterized membrane protein YwzB
MSGKLRGIFSRNAVTIVMVPALIFIHWGWYKLQDVEVFVKKEEKKDLPIVIVSFEKVFFSFILRMS